MKYYLENLRNLFCDDDSVVYKALLEKKDWINNSFYIVGSFQDNKDIEDIFEQRIRFRKLYLEHTKYEAFRVLYLFDNFPETLSDDEFIIKYDFKRLTEQEFKILFANFYPCLNQEERLIEEENPQVQDMKLYMNKDLGDNVIILDQMNLKDSCFKCHVIEKIIAPKSLNAGYLVYLKLLCEKLHILLEDNCHE